MREKQAETGDNARKKRRIGKVLLAWLLVLLVLILLLGIGFLIFRAAGRYRLKNKVETSAPSMSIEVTEGEEEKEIDYSKYGINLDPVEGEVSDWQDDWVVYDGKIYDYNEDIMTFLVMGIDKDGPVEKAKDHTDGGQADAIFLVVMNPTDNTIKMIGVNRETMVPIRMVGSGDFGGDKYTTAQLETQHGFGDGLEQSCELMVDAVSKLFYDLPIYGYVSFNLGGIVELCDTLGGVEVVAIEDMSLYGENGWKKGQKLILKGEMARKYIQTRNELLFESARLRLERQKQVVTLLAQKALQQTKEDITTPVRLYTQFKPYMVTDLSVDQVTWLAGEAIKCAIYTDQIYSMEGETVKNGQFEEFYPDKEALKKMMLEIFYQEIETVN